MVDQIARSEIATNDGFCSREDLASVVPVGWQINATWITQDTKSIQPPSRALSPVGTRHKTKAYRCSRCGGKGTPI